MTGDSTAVDAGLGSSFHSSIESITSRSEIRLISSMINSDNGTAVGSFQSASNSS